MDMSVVRSVPISPLYTQCCQWIINTFHRARIETDLGSKLYATFRKAELPGPQMAIGAIIGGGPEALGYEYVTQVIRTLLPLAEQFGITTAAEVELDTLTNRIRNEVVANKGIVISPSMVGAWARKPL
jgi:hypothetical protein